MVYIEAPNTIESDKKSLFLAGGISGCPEWQKKVIAKLKYLDIVVYNPRRANFDIDDSDVAKEQVIWEHKCLKKADIISFWFCAETIQPITLYELGAHSMTNKPLVIGVDSDYERIFDVTIQTRLVRPQLKIVHSLDELSDGIFKVVNEISFI